MRNKIVNTSKASNLCVYGGSKKREKKGRGGKGGTRKVLQVSRYIIVTP